MAVGGNGRAMISLRGVTKRFQGASAVPAVDDLSLDVADGEIVVLVGPSGCGKTTTMRMINRLIEPDGGTIEVDGRDVMAQNPDELRRRIGYVIQTIGLLPHRTVEQNVGTVPWLLGWDKPRIQARVRELAEQIHLDDELLGRYPAELSGGQRQRVGVARAHAADPPVMLMDEPFAAVDPIVRAALQDQFLELQRTLRKTIVFVTHDIDEAIKMADRIAILNVGAKVAQFDTPEEILRAPASPFVEAFVGAERGLKRLALIPVSTLELDPPRSGASLPTVSSSDSLRFALDAIVTAGGDAASVVDDGQPRGTLTLARLGHEIEEGS